MRFTTGHRLGPYEIEAPIGEGGMGEVYRARDPRLDRTVAIKVLPEGLARHPGARQRFEREARAIAKLSHPNICALYDVGAEGEDSWLVMEMIEGETLAERLERRAGSSSALSSTSSRAAVGGLPLSQALTYATEIADALAAAHRQGIVHRDLTSRNVMITRAGVKLLDFGLAKALDPSQVPEPPDPEARSRVSTTPEMTKDGAVIGTYPYMSPEQVEGRAVDARSDIFSLAVLIYEMVTGQRPFQGRSRAGLIASILEHDPSPMTEHQRATPPSLQRLVRQCLAKDPDERWQSAADVRKELAWIAETAGTTTPDRPRAGRRTTVALLAGAALLVAGGTAVVTRRTPVGPPPPLVRFPVSIPGQWESFKMALSPDGRRLVYATTTDGRAQLWLRPLDGEAAQPLAGIGAVRAPFFSPDGRTLIFGSEGKLKRLDLSGGSVQVICDEPTGLTGGSWGADGTIVMSTYPGDLLRVPAAGGTARLALPTAPAGQGVVRAGPHFLPDGRRFLFLQMGQDPDRSGIHLSSLSGEAPRRLLPDRSQAAYAAGQLLYAKDGSLVAQPFDASSGRVQGEPVTVVERVGFTAITGNIAFAVSPAGILVSRAPAYQLRQLTWVTRDGERSATLAQPAPYDNFDLSPDGTKVAAAIMDEANSLAAVWIIDVVRGSRSLLRAAKDQAFNDPVWSPDGTRVGYTVRGMGRRALAARPLDGGDEQVLLAPQGAAAIAEDWSAHGDRLAVLIIPDENRRRRGAVIGQGGKGQPVFFDDSDREVDETQFSPDGRWLAYGAPQSGRWEIYVAAVPPGRERHLVSTEGGAQPRWRADGRELYYLGLDGTMMAVAIGDGAEPGIPKALFQTGIKVLPNYDQFSPSPDGKRFLVLLPSDGAADAPLDVTVNWPSLLAR